MQAGDPPGGEQAVWDEIGAVSLITVRADTGARPARGAGRAAACGRPV